MKISPSIMRYWLAMNATAFDSAVAATRIYSGAAVAHVATAEIGYTIPAITLQQFVIAFLSAFGWSILQYLQAHPVAELLTHEDVLSQIEQELAADLLKNKGGGGNATASRAAEPTAVPAIPFPQ
jgi:hypothetical protein